MDQNNTDTTTSAFPEDGPWSASWQDLAGKAGNLVSNAAQSAVQAASNIKMPWDSDASDIAAITNNKKPDVIVQPSTSPQKSLLGFGDIFSRLVNTESAGKHVDANGNLLTSNKGAQGITQVLPNTGENPGYGVTPIQNHTQDEYIRFGRDYLNAMLKNFGGNQEQAVAAYNAGPGRIEKAVARASATGGDWKNYIPLETQKYVRKILG